MQVVKGLAKLLAPLHHQLLGLGSVGVQQSLQRLAFHKVLDDVDDVAVINNVHDPHDCRVVQLLDHVRLGNGALNHDLVVAVLGFLFDFLDGPGLVQPLVHGQIDLGHTALADELQDFIFIVNNLSEYGQAVRLPYIVLMSMAEILSVSPQAMSFSTKDTILRFITTSLAFPSGRKASPIS